MSALPLSIAARGESLFVNKLADLEAVFDDAYSTVVWRRAPLLLPDAAFGRWHSRLGRVLRELDASECRAHAIAGLCDLPIDSPLACDLASLGDLFATLTGARTLGLRIDSTDARTCPRFHVDNVALRMLCTYRGPGTDWLDDVDINRHKLGAGAEGLSDDASGLYCARAAIRNAATYDVVLLKGEHWPGNEGFGAVHRSPAVPAGKTRLLVSWDAV
jgi:hypothetical protein